VRTYCFGYGLAQEERESTGTGVSWLTSEVVLFRVVQLFMDASNMGWGAHMGDNALGGLVSSGDYIGLGQLHSGGVHNQAGQLCHLTEELLHL
jgi:hypothetical protein